MLGLGVSQVSFKTKKNVWKFSGHESDVKQLLFNVNMVARAGEVTCIIGPSGCGKTTLLNVLSGRAIGDVEGDVLWNGQDVPVKELKGCVSLLHANDRLLPNLSVEETLMFSATLSMRSATEDERISRVEEIMKLLHLNHVRSIFIGGATHKGLSSGEVRRVSIGMELLTNPKVLMIDEPTTGLDAVMASTMMEVIHNIAATGVAVIVTLHQPRVSIVSLCDNIVAMGSGRIIFQGNAIQARSFLVSVSNMAPPSGGAICEIDSIDKAANCNIADELLDIGSHHHSDWVADIFAKEFESRVIDEIALMKKGFILVRTSGNFGPSNTFMSDQSSLVDAVDGTLGDVGNMVRPAGTQQTKAADPRSFKAEDSRGLRGWFEEVHAVSYRHFRNMWNRPWVFIITSVLQIALGCFLGAIFFDLPGQYLPSVEPIPIGDVDSPVMQLLDNSLFNFLAYGMDGQGYNPFVAMITDGIDGKGAAARSLSLLSDEVEGSAVGSEPFSQILDSLLLPRLSNMMSCAHNRLNLESRPEYARTDFTEYWSQWGLSNEAHFDGEPGEFFLDESKPPQVASTILQSLQFFDGLLYNQPWLDLHNHCTEAGGTYVACFGCYNPLAEWLDVASECTEIPQQPTGAHPCTGTIQHWHPLDLVEGFWNADVPSETRSMWAPVTVDYPTTTTTTTQKVKSVRVRKNRKTTTTEEAELEEEKSASKRQLQLNSLAGEGAIDIDAFIPDRARDLIDAFSQYTDALRMCDHPGCMKVVNILDGVNTRVLDAVETIQVIRGDKPKTKAVDDEEAESTVGDYGAVVGAVLNITGALFFSVANVGFCAYDALTTVVQERPLLNREIRNHTYRPSTYIIGKYLGEFIFQLIPAMAVTITFYFLVGFDSGPSGIYFWKYLLIVLVLIFACYGFSYCISAFCPSMEVAVIAAPMFLVLFLCTSGFFVRDDSIPVGMAWLKYISIFRWGFFALCNNFFPSGEYFWGIPNDFSLNLLSITNTSFGMCTFAIFLCGLGFRILGYVGVKWTNRKVGIES